MSGNNRNIPNGTRDIMFEEAELFRDLEERLTGLYVKRGFSEIMTPGIEYYDVFETGSTMAEEEMYKLTAPDGRLLVLRADNTTPIARAAASRLSEHIPTKLFYHQRVYRLSYGNKGRKSEIAQSGVEILGCDGIQSDLLCLITAIETLSCVSDDYKLELGHVGFYNALISACALGDGEAERIRRLVDAKDVNKLSELDVIKKIPFLFGGEEVFSDAEALAEGNAEAMRALSYLKELYGALCRAGYKDKIMIDLGIVHSLDYYTGCVFRGYMDGAGVPVLAGGRYDTLISKFASDIPATGFGVNISEIAETLMRKAPPKKRSYRELIAFDIEGFKEANAYIGESDGGVLSHINGEKENLTYAEREGFERVIFFLGERKKTVELKKEGSERK